MTRLTRTLIVLLTVALFAVSCGGGDETADADEPVESTTTAPTTTVAPTTTTVMATTTTAPTTTTVVPTTTTAAPTTTTTIAADTTAPAAPTGLVCEAGGGSGEVTLSWDAPDPADGVATAQIYMRELGGSFTRLHTYTEADVLSADASRWVANVFPVVFGAPIELAVTWDDAVGNESGWNPIDAYVPFAGAGCESGAPGAPAVNAAVRGAGSLEVDLSVFGAADIVDWAVQVDQGSGFVDVTVLFVNSTGIGSADLVISPIDWTLPAVYRVTATDAHGNVSAAGERNCPIPISPGDVAC